VKAGLALVAACRPRQWIKNGLVFVPLVSSASFRSAEAVQHTAVAAASFALLSSAVYLFNDLADREYDRAHPLKKQRPIASGALGPGAAAGAGLVLAALAMALAWPLGPWVRGVLATYGIFNAAYSAGLRRQPVLDVLLVSSGFVLRPLAGAYAIPVRVSPWLFVVSLLLALLLALLKRRAELTGLDHLALGHRPALGGYSTRFLDLLIAITAGAGTISYALYSFQSEHGDGMLATLPLFLYGLFRYLYLVYERGAGASPEEVFLSDRPLQIDAILYLALVVAILSGSI
jgi:4-hydroxybenzoate polyprenyltransferase